jgi:hypothetical protein
MRRLLCLTLAALLAAVTAGCSYESRSVSLREPGVYKGARDPLLDKRLEGELAVRLKLVQGDR